MSQTLEKRVEELEHKLAELTHEVTARRPRKKDWQKTFGLSRGDDGFKEMVKLGREYRQSLRDKATVLVLDTDHLVEFDEASNAGARLKKRLAAANEEIAATIISVEEQFRGWAAQIHRLHADPHAQIPAYARLKRRLEFYAGWNVYRGTLAALGALSIFAAEACASARWI